MKKYLQLTVVCLAVLAVCRCTEKTLLGDCRIYQDTVYGDTVYGDTAYILVDAGTKVPRPWIGLMGNTEAVDTLFVVIPVEWWSDSLVVIGRPRGSSLRPRI